MLISSDKSPEHYVFGTLFIIGGFSCIMYLHCLTIDRNSQQLIHERGLLFPFRRKRYSLRKIKAIKVFVKIDRNGDKERTTYPIQLSGIKDAVVLKHGNPWFSRVLAEQLARLLNVPLVNRVYGVSSTRNPDELDMPLIDRWIRDDERFSRPSLASSTTLIESMHGSTYELSILAQWPKLTYFAVLPFLIAVPAIVDFPPTEFFHSQPYRIFAVFSVGIGFLMLAFVGRSNLRITPDEVSFRQGYFPVRSKLRIKEIEEMIVAGDGITLVADTKAVWIHWGGNKKDSDYLEAVVPYQMLRLGRYAPHRTLSDELG